MAWRPHWHIRPYISCGYLVDHPLALFLPFSEARWASVTNAGRWKMRLGSSLLLLVVTAGFAALAVTSARPQGGQGDDVRLEDVDAWFV